MLPDVALGFDKDYSTNAKPNWCHSQTYGVLNYTIIRRRKYENLKFVDEVTIQRAPRISTYRARKVSHVKKRRTVKNVALKKGCMNRLG